MDKRQQIDPAAYYECNPPECLSGFIAKPIKPEGLMLDGHGGSGSIADGVNDTINIVFQIICQCGNSSFNLLINSIPNEAEDSRKRYSLECTSCGSRQLIFDPTKHGYDSEVVQMEGFAGSYDSAIATENSQQGRSDSKACCSHCNGSTFEFTVRVEYFDDVFGDPDYQKREQDYFSWFSGIGKCLTCTNSNNLIDYECS